MDITYLGHASFKLRGKTASLVTDPYDSSVAKFPKVESSIITISHDHPDHNGIKQVVGETFVINGPGEYEIQGVKITGISSFHDQKKGVERGKNTIYNIMIDDLYVCHLGDLGQDELTSGELESIGQVHILLIPTGGLTTIDASVAAKIAASLEPKIVIPMHYGEDFGQKLEPVEKFLKEMGVENATLVPKLIISKEKLPEELQVVVMEKSK